MDGIHSDPQPLSGGLQIVDGHNDSVGCVGCAGCAGCVGYGVECDDAYASYRA